MRLAVETQSELTVPEHRMEDPVDTITTFSIRDSCIRKKKYGFEYICAFIKEGMIVPRPLN